MFFTKNQALICLPLMMLISSWGFPVSAQIDSIQEFMDQDGQFGNGTMRVLRKMMGGLMTAGNEIANRMASGPGVYDMVRNDSQLGINVLSGLVKVDRVREPGKPRALSVRVFGIPVFNTGFGRDDVLPSDRGRKSEPGVSLGSSGGGAGGSEEEDLPLEP